MDTYWKTSKAVPWDLLCIDVVGPYMVTVDKYKNKEDVTHTFHVMTFINPEKCWFEVQEIPDKTFQNHVSSTRYCVVFSRYL